MDDLRAWQSKIAENGSRDHGQKWPKVRFGVQSENVQFGATYEKHMQVEGQLNEAWGSGK
jgi:hypothetical protein